MRQRHWPIIGAIVASVVLLAGCAGASDYPAFDRATTDQDVLPEDFPLLADAQENQNLNLDSLRYVAAYDTASLYLIRTMSDSVCLVVAAGKDSVVACGGSGLVGTQSPAGQFEVGPAPIGEKDGWTVLSENVRVLDD